MFVFVQAESFEPLTFRDARIDSVTLYKLVFQSSLRSYRMKRLIVSLLLAVALLTSGVLVSQFDMLGTAYADGDGGE